MKKINGFVVRILLISRRPNISEFVINILLASRKWKQKPIVLSSGFCLYLKNGKIHEFGVRILILHVSLSGFVFKILLAFQKWKNHWIYRQNSARFSKWKNKINGFLVRILLISQRWKDRWNCPWNSALFSRMEILVGLSSKFFSLTEEGKISVTCRQNSALSQRY